MSTHRPMFSFHFSPNSQNFFSFLITTIKTWNTHTHINKTKQNKTNKWQGIFLLFWSFISRRNFFLNKYKWNEMKSRKESRQKCIVVVRSLLKLLFWKLAAEPFYSHIVLVVLHFVRRYKIFWQPDDVHTSNSFKFNYTHTHTQSTNKRRKIIECHQFSVAARNWIKKQQKKNFLFSLWERHDIVCSLFSF